MPVLGTPTYAQSGKFAFPRSFIKNVNFRFGANALFTQSEGNFFITDGNNPIVHVVCNYQPNFWLWSSNTYTLDYVLKDWWVLVDPDPTPQPLNFDYGWWINPTSKVPELVLSLSGFSHEYPYALPPAPPSYWKPPWL